jgi:hypothetical protein
MPKQYQVVGACAIITQDTFQGPTKLTMYQGAFIGPGATDKEIAHNLEAKLIAEVGGDVEVPESATVPIPNPFAGSDEGVAVDTTGATPPVLDDGAPVGEETDAAREEAKSKLPADGSAPPANAATAVWVEYAVTKAYDYDTVKAENRAVLIALTAGK